MNIGQRIKSRREELNLTQMDVAKRCGYKSRSSIQKLEDCRDLPIRMVSIMANALETTEAYLMGWEDDYPEIATGQADAQLLEKIHLLNNANRQVLIATLDALIESQRNSSDNNP